MKYAVRVMLMGAALGIALVVGMAVPALAQRMGGGFGGLSGGPEEPKVSVQGQFIAPQDGKPSRLFLTATIDSGWHIYSIDQAPGGPIRTEIKLDPSNAYRVTGKFQASPGPEKKREPAFKNLMVESHHGSVTWYAPIELAPGVNPADVKITGVIYAQPCYEGGCLPPQDFAFTARLGRGVPVAEAAPAPAAVERASNTEGLSSPSVGPLPAAKPGSGVADSGIHWLSYSTAEKFRRLVGDQWDPEVMRANLVGQLKASNLVQNILLGFLGGIILNLMPCVLPVIGLKVLSFAEQAGHDRRRVIALNGAYSAGMIAVFVLLAALAVGLHLGWGHLFKYPAFNIAFAAIVFAMGLSFLGVWEIPIPGFASYGTVAQAAEHEGLSGAFVKGIITTLLATPCTGPFMGGALTWAVNQPPLNTFVVFASVGLGMASPYLVIAVFPGLLRFVPKPGAWMDTFRRIMGFVLLATVVYIFTFLEPAYVVPTIGLLFALWAALWWIGREGLVAAEVGAKTLAWMQAAAFAGVMWIVLFPGTTKITAGALPFRGLYEIMADRLGRPAAAEEEWNLPPGRYTVLVDFTADWCLTCKTLEATVLDTAEVREALQRNGVVPIKADWTHEAPEVTRFLDSLGSRQVPVIAVFPAGDPNRPIIFRDGYTRAMILDALQKAGPSKIAASDGKTLSTATR